MNAVDNARRVFVPPFDVRCASDDAVYQCPCSLRHRLLQNIRVRHSNNQSMPQILIIDPNIPDRQPLARQQLSLLLFRALQCSYARHHRVVEMQLLSRRAHSRNNQLVDHDDRVRRYSRAELSQDSPADVVVPVAQDPAEVVHFRGFDWLWRQKVMRHGF